MSEEGAAAAATAQALALRAQAIALAAAATAAEEGNSDAEDDSKRGKKNQNQNKNNDSDAEVSSEDAAAAVAAVAAEEDSDREKKNSDADAEEASDKEEVAAEPEEQQADNGNASDNDASGDDAAAVAAATAAALIAQAQAEVLVATATEDDSDADKKSKNKKGSDDEASDNESADEPADKPADEAAKAEALIAQTQAMVAAAVVEDAASGSDSDERKKKKRQKKKRQKNSDDEASDDEAEEEPIPNSISASDLKTNLSDYVLVDLRGRKKHKKARLPHTDGNVYIGEFLTLARSRKLSDFLPEVDHHPVAVYCDNGKMSLFVAQRVKQLTGGTCVALLGGVQSWTALGYPTEKGAQGADDQVYSDAGNSAQELKRENDKLRDELKQLVARAEHATKKIKRATNKAGRSYVPAAVDHQHEPRDASLKPRPPVAQSNSTEGKELNNALRRCKIYQKQITGLRKQLDEGSNNELVIELKNTVLDQRRQIKAGKSEIRSLKTVQKRMDSQIREPQEERDDMAIKIQTAHEEVRVAKAELKKVVRQHEQDELHMRRQQERMMALEKVVRSINERKGQGGVSRTEKRLNRQIEKLTLDLENAVEQHAAERKNFSLIIDRRGRKTKYLTSVAEPTMKLLENMYHKAENKGAFPEYTAIFNKLQHAHDFAVKYVPPPKKRRPTIVKALRQPKLLPKLVGQNGKSKSARGRGRGYKARKNAKKNAIRKSGKPQSARTHTKTTVETVGGKVTTTVEETIIEVVQEEQKKPEEEKQEPKKLEVDPNDPAAVAVAQALELQAMVLAQTAAAQAEKAAAAEN